ncbi:MAG: nitrous oxide reductase accessory protein NosL [Desulfobulbaceae bacterium]|nr:nitrous oxide reductase accessory protein NosL [Desulfobulbaceae bacterium]
MLCSFNKIMGLAGVLLLIAFGGSLQAAPEEKVGHDERCSVCGMFVAKYENWIVQVRFADDRVMFFDGVKDMLVFYFNPRKYSDKERQDISEIWVKDYYSLGWLDGRKAFYVTGSDVYGPMGKEFIPFDSRESADNFLRDHQGREVLRFEEITDDIVQSMRSGSKMRHGDN